MAETLPGAGELDAARDVLAKRYPNAEVRGYRKADTRGVREEWVLMLRAGSPDDLEEELVAAACGVPPLRAVRHGLPLWARDLARVFPDYDFRPYGCSRGYAVLAQRNGDGDGPCLVITGDANEMRAALATTAAEARTP
jgi:hypothetical protein